MFSKLMHSRGVVLRKMYGRLEALFQMGAPLPGGDTVALADVFPPARLMLVGLGLVFAVVLIVYSAMFGAPSTGAESFGFLAIGPTVVRDLKTVLKELREFQTKTKGRALTAEEGTQFETLANEAKQMQDEVEREAKVTGVAKLADDLEKEAKRLGKPALVPGDSQPGDEGEEKAEPVAGYMALGDYIVAQKGLRDFLAAGKPKTAFAIAALSGLVRARAMFGKRKFSGEPMIPITVAEYKAMRAGAKGTKAVPTLGADVIEPTRLADMVRVDEHEQLRLRDILNIGRTNSNAVIYNRIASVTRAAATVAHGAQKPEAALEIDSVTETVRTIAAWIPINDQQLDDMPALSGIINTELLYDLDRVVEELVMYGDGIGQNFAGIVPNASVLAMREEGGDTLIDVIRRGITDVRRDGYIPNGVAIDPLDWETIVLTKGSDNRYVWVIVTEENVSRLWGVPVVETTAMTELGTDARNILLGDWTRGATLWDRMDSTISIGWQNDQFIRNQRTILAELRAAFGTRRPRAFRKHETNAGS